jgi:demethylspheroidene O-methyltransferase
MQPRSVRDLLDLLDGGVTAAAFGAALELDLFRLLAAHPRPSASLATELGLGPRRCRAWLDVLLGAGLLDEDERGFAPSALAREGVLETYGAEAWALLAEQARGRHATIVDLPARLREPDPAPDAPEETGATPDEYVRAMRDDPQRARRFTRMLAALHAPFARELARDLDLAGVRRLADLGGGSGVVALTLARRWPALAVTIVDIATVCDAARPLVGAADDDLAARIGFHPADLLADPLPGRFDAALQCDVDLFDEHLFRKVHAALETGGRYILVDQLAPGPGVAPPARRHWALAAAARGADLGALTIDEVTARLARSGFEILDARPLPTAPDDPLDEDTTIIEARKK